MRGFWCTVLTIAHPERVDKLVLLGGMYGLDRSLPLFLRLSSKRWLRRLLFATIFRPSLKGTRMMYKQLGDNVDKILQEYLECEYLYTSLPSVLESGFTAVEEAATFRGINPEYYIRDEMANIRTPTLFIWGDKDTAIPLERGRKASEIMPNSRFEVVKDAGHLPWHD